MELRNVSFKYPGQDNYLFKNLNIKIQKGSILGISGSSGTGKTTLLNILLGFLKPEKGTLLLNQKEIDNDFNYPTNFCILATRCFLIDDTLSANIALGENELENENFLISIKKAKIDSFVRQLPMGAKTLLGERGAKISGGQKQRIALARAFYFQSKIIVLDESTSSLDKNTQQEILDEIKLLKKESTFIIISHDENVLKICDNIIYL